MNPESKLARLMRNTGPARFFVPFGLILIVFGVILLGFKTDDFLETTGKITSVTETRNEKNEKEYSVSFTYQVGGREYTGSFENLPGSFAEGDDIKIFYDPADPERITNSKLGRIIAPAAIVLGAAAVIFGVLNAAKAFRKSKELDQLSPGKGAPAADFDAFKTDPGVTEYYCRHDGSLLKPGYILEDAARSVLFEGKMLKNNPVGPRTFEFTDHTNGYTARHEVGHTVTQSFNNEFFSVKSWFKFDGKNVWDLLHERGFRMMTDMHSRFPNLGYDVALNGRPFARIETSSQYVHEEDEAAHALSVPAGKYYYRIWTDSADLESLFLIVFAVSETEQTVVE